MEAPKQRIRVLYLEDDPSDIELTLRHMERHASHLEFTVVSSGNEALKRLDTEHYDALLLDFGVPDRTGLEVLGELNRRGPDIPAVMVTGSGDAVTAVQVLKAGAFDYVVKKENYLTALPAAIEAAITRFRGSAPIRGRRTIRCLYAEHNPADVELTLRHFRAHAPHFIFEVVPTGEEALRRLEAGGLDLLLLDYKLAGLDGIRVLQEMRERRIPTPVVMVTGQGDEDTVVQALKLGALDYVVKRPDYLNRLPSALENALIRHRLAEEREALIVLNGLARAVASSMEPQEIFRRVVEAAHPLLKADQCLLNRLADDGVSLTPAAWKGIPDAAAGSLIFRVGEGLPGQAALHRQPVTAPRPGPGDEASPGLHGQDRFTPMLCSPIVSGEELVGVLSVASTTPREFNSMEMTLLSTLADHAAIAIQNARLFRKVKDQLAGLQAFYQATKLLTSEHFLDTLLQQAVETAARVIGARYGAISLWNEAGMVQTFVQTGLSLEEAARIGEFPTGLGILGVLLREPRPLRLDDLATDPRAHGFPPHHPPMTRFLGVPIMTRGKVLGSLYLTEKESGPFTAEDETLFTSFVEIIAGLIENARLHQDLRLAARHLEATVEDRTRDLQAANAQLQEAMSQVQEASRHKSEFLANMSHELRTPLNSIIGFSELLLERGVDPLAERQARYLTHIHNSGRHLLQLISDILDLSKVEAGRFVLQPEVLPVAQTLEDILVIARGLASKKGQSVETQVASDLPPLHADPVRFKQILFNLLTNALKFTPEGGTITVHARSVMAEEHGSEGAEGGSPVPLSPSAPLQFLEIAVTDTGMGIRPEDLPRLFQEFVQLETTQAHKHEGTGLGLALTKKLVEMHRGRIRVESEGEGRGSTFTIRLPRAGPEESAGAQQD